MSEELVLYETDEKVGIITINRPEKLNAVSPELRGKLCDAFARADADETTSVVVLRANGDTQRDEDDFRAVWQVAGGVRLLEAEHWSGGVIGSSSQARS